MNINSMPAIPKIILILLVIPSLSQIHAAEYEQPPTLSADILFPDIELTKDHYKVQKNVPTDGFLTRATIKSDFGTFTAAGPGMLQVRLNEINALLKLETLEASAEFKRGAKESTSEKAGAFKQLYEKPKETAAGIGEGVNRFFKRTARAAKTGIQTIDDVYHDRTPGSSGTAGPGAKLPGNDIMETPVEKESKYKKAAQASGETALNILGFDDSRRKLAKRLGVDPYTTNPVLDEKLDEVTWSIFAGDLGIDIATSLIPGSIVVTTSTLATNLVWDTPPGDLRLRIEKTLLGLGIQQSQVDQLLRHRMYPLSYQAAFSNAMESLGKLDGIATVMPLALTVTSVGQARYMVNSLRMLASYHESVKPLKSITVDGTVVARNADEVNIIVSPIDYLSWTSVIDNFISKDRFKGQKNELHIAGKMTDMATERLQKRAWVLHENSKLFSFTR
jgi:hypothetical protein